MSKFKVGDVVIVSNKPEVDKKYEGCYFTESMKKFVGKVGTIIKVIPYNDDQDEYYLDFTNQDFFWTNSMLEFIDTQKIALKKLDAYYLKNEVKCETCDVESECKIYKEISNNETICGTLSLISSLTR